MVLYREELFMKKILIVSSVVCILLVLFSGCAGLKTVDSTVLYEYISSDFTYGSRGVEIPATIVIPKGNGPYPLVVLVHGHGGSREENIGFGTIAKALAQKGIASVRMDFSGCGESSESFQKNYLSNMEADVLAAIETAKTLFRVDGGKVGIFGYSMGGRIAIELIGAEAYAFKSAVFLAPAASTGNLKNLFGGADNWEKLKAVAKRDGYVVFTTIYGSTQELSSIWFDELEKDENPAAQAAEKFKGPSLVIYATNDEAVSPSVSQNVADLFKSSVVNTTADGHSYGFYSDRTDVLDTVVKSTVDFFAGSLR